MSCKMKSGGAFVFPSVNVELNVFSSLVPAYVQFKVTHVEDTLSFCVSSNCNDTSQDYKIGTIQLRQTSQEVSVFP